MNHSQRILHMNERDYESRIRELEEENKVMKERYRILAETTSALLFEYRPAEDIMIFLYNFPDNKKRREIQNYKEFMKKDPLVHPDHVKAFMNVLMRASKSPEKGELEYLSKVSTGEFQWHRTYYSSIVNEQGRVLSVLGKIDNIHESVTEKQRMQHRVETDALTGLYNRVAISEKVGSWLKANPTGEAYMIMIDVDNFKTINDRYGHSVGDDVLCEVAKLLLSCFGDNSIFSRFGGDEFVGFLTDEPAVCVQSRADCFMQRLEEEIASVEQQVHCSIGITGRLSKYDEFEDLFNRSDNAMYQAKKTGKNRYYVYKE